MARFTDEQRTANVSLYYEGKCCYRYVKKHFKQRFHLDKNFELSGKSIWRIVNRFKEQRRIIDNHKGRSGRPRTVVTQANSNAVLTAIEQADGNTSIRRLSGQLGISRSSVQVILKNNRLYPYKTPMLQAQSPQNVQQRLDFCRMMTTKERSHQLIIFSDECHSQLSGWVNSNNYRHWSRTNERVHLV